MKGAKLVEVLQRTHWVIRQQTKGLSHDDSMLRLPFWDNNMNWILGHIIHYRDKALLELGVNPALAKTETALYARESEPLTDADQAVSLSALLAALDDTQDKLVRALEDVTEEALEEVYDAERGRTVGDRLDFLFWHETYHVGQLEILRQLAGTNDAII